MIVAFAGRRVDAEDSKSEAFPLSNVTIVEQRLRGFFESNEVKGLVCSAACGADLLALKVATEMNIPRKILLPTDVRQFKTTSVSDRPGEWDDLYDQMVDTQQGTMELFELHLYDKEGSSYKMTNTLILEEAFIMSQAFAPREEVVALVAWEGKPKNANDYTEHFCREAEERNIPVQEILTI